MSSLSQIQAALRDEIRALSEKAKVPGYVAGIYHHGKQSELAVGTANLNTQAPMTTDTSWLLGSVSKVLTTHLVLRYVEKGLVDLDAPVVRYLPDFRLSEPGAAERIRVRQLLNHTNGIDADTLMPVVEAGPGAMKSYVDMLARCGTLFAPGGFIHYSNPGFVLAGRIVEVLSGATYNQVLEQELFAPVGMDRSCTSAAQAILHRTAIGSFPDPKTGEPRATPLFMLPASAAAAGATQIVTIGDLLKFARTHLRGGVAPEGRRVLSEDHVRLMQAPSFDLKTPSLPAMGLGWWLAPVAGTTALCHGGGSPGGVSSLAVFPELDLAIAGFGNSPAAPMIHDAVVETVLERGFGRRVEWSPQPRRVSDLVRYEGVYGSFQARHHLTAHTDHLSLRAEFVPFDDEHLRVLARYGGVEPTVEAMQKPAVDYIPVAEDLFVAKAARLDACAGLWGRMNLLSFHGDDGNGRPRYMHSGFRCARREDLSARSQ